MSIPSIITIFLLLFTTGSVPAEDIGVAEIATGNRSFAFDLFQRLSQADGNIFFSPYSISTALAMTYAGARTITEDEMASVLHFHGEQEEFHPAYSALQQSINVIAEHNGIDLHLANSIWCQRGYHFLPEFRTTTNEYYSAHPFLVDFVNRTEQTRLQINEWVSDQTKGLIKDLIRPGILTPLVRLVLCNAIHFKSSWATSFDAAQTRHETFHVSEEHSVTVPMMWVKSDFRYLDSEGFGMIELPYSGNGCSMVILLPNKDAVLSATEDTITPEKLEILLDRLSSAPHTLISVKLPKFSMTQSFELADTLSEMGMPHAFQGADFSGMTGDRDLFISNVIHKAFLEVTEEGTEAAAATAVVMKRGPVPPRFFCDHPFMFLIRELSTNSIIFMGRLADPLQE